ncbi:MAG: hypothetical protein IJ709_01900 [Selenomonas sp.]|nr:hypothetical protein [Selenomonas sp.]
MYNDIIALIICLLLALFIAGVLKLKVLASMSWGNSIIAGGMSLVLVLFVIMSLIKETQEGKFASLKISEKVMRSVFLARAMLVLLPLIHDVAVDTALELIEKMATSSASMRMQKNTAYGNLKYALNNGCP